LIALKFKHLGVQMSYPCAQSIPSATHLNFSRDLNNLIDVTDSMKIGGLPQVYNEHRQLFEGKQLNDLLVNSFKPEKHLSFTMQTPPPLPVLEIPPIAAQKDLSATCVKIVKCVDADIPEDSIYRKLLACIPIIGVIPSIINQGSLRKTITQTKESARLVKLISIKNQYKISSIIRQLLSVALIVAGVSLTILCGPIGIVTGIMIGSCTAFDAYGIHKNKQILDELQANGLPSSGIRVR
jgi:hypothetical protein